MWVTSDPEKLVFDAVSSYAVCKCRRDDGTRRLCRQPAAVTWEYRSSFPQGVEPYPMMGSIMDHSLCEAHALALGYSKEGEC